MTTPETPSVRTPEHPMAFTRDELLSGALTTWVLFLALLPAGLLLAAIAAIPGSSGFDLGAVGLLAVMVLVVVVVAGVVALLLLPFVLLAVWPLATALHGVRPIAIHLLCYTLIGAGLGYAYLAIFGGPDASWFLSPAGAVTFGTPAIAVTLAVPLGWWLTARRALRRDAGLLPRSRRRIDHDAATEDVLADTDSASPIR
ncbi:hypothetical protein [Microbacterium sp.]|uniref:hypothetical protein n=1 Tax=Microbacterium sp. TaxID=51671 RepID=UPI0035694BFB